MSWIRYVIAGVLAALLVFLLWRANRDRVRAERERDAYRSIVLMQEDTIEIAQDVYQKKVVELLEIRALLDRSREEVARLMAKISERDGEIVAYVDLALTWRKKYEAAIKSVRQEVIEIIRCEDGTGPLLPRIRVEFDHDFGPFRVEGHTVTSPPEAFVSVSQTRPLRLGVALVQEKDGSWNTVASSSEDGFEVDVSLSAKHRDLKRITWRDKLSTELSVGLLGSPSAGVGLTYGEDLALGPRCTIFEDGWSCGVGLSWKPFAR